MKARLVVLAAGFATLLFSSPLAAQTGSISGRVTDERGNPLAGAAVRVVGPSAISARSGATGAYVLESVPAGSRTIQARLIGFRSQTAQVAVAAGQRANQDFSLAADPLKLEAVVVTGTQTPRTKLETSNATTVLTAADITQASPRSTTEALRYVPGFTRVESSGGEVNQNISMRGILGVEYVMFMEDGLPVFPTMHTFFMNADNLFRMDENIERMEVVRGGSSALFGSNTPGAIVNLINKTGGAEPSGSMKATGASAGLARYDFNLNGPLGSDWRFNLGGFYRYDHGVRDPGYPGIRGGQFKGSLTHLLDNGHFRLSLKMIDDRNQFILPLPFRNPDDPEYVPGFSDDGAMSTREGLHLRVPLPTGEELELPLDDGLRTKATWLTGDVAFDLGQGWAIHNTAQLMENDQGWNAIVPFDVQEDTVFLNRLGITADSIRLFYTNQFDAPGVPTRFNTANGLVAPGGEWHVEKPLTAFQNQLQVRKTTGENSFSLGLYFANYTQGNRWFFTEILTDVRDNPRFLDVVAYSGGTPRQITSNGFRNFLSLYVNGSGQTTVFSGVVGGSVKLSERVRADAGVRYEADDFVLSVENTAKIDLDGDPATTYDNETWGTGTFRQFQRAFDDWAASLGLNYALNPNMSLYAQGSRGFKMPALDEFLFSESQGRVDAFDPQQNWTAEAGVKYASRRYAATVNGFFTELRNITGQGAVTNPATGEITWITQTAPETRSYGLEIEAAAALSSRLSVLATGTILKADFAACPDTAADSTAAPCPGGADVGTFLLGVPPLIGNVAATYTAPGGLQLVADWHFVARRYSTFADSAGNRNRLPTYSYLNLRGAYRLPGQPLTLSAELLNAYQSKGLEEGNPRLTQVGGRTSDLFLARPILPRRFMASVRYEF